MATNNTKHVQLAEQASTIAGTTPATSLDDIDLEVQSSTEKITSPRANTRPPLTSRCWFIAAVALVIVGTAAGIFYVIKPEWRCFWLMKSDCPALKKALITPTVAPTTMVPLPVVPPRNDTTQPPTGCPAGLSTCGGGACHDLGSDARHCGLCGRACAAGAACRHGDCEPATTDPTSPPTPAPTAAPPLPEPAARGVAYVWAARTTGSSALAAGDAGTRYAFETGFVDALESLLSSAGGNGGGRSGLRRQLASGGPAVAPNAVIVPAPAPAADLLSVIALRVTALVAQNDPQDKASGVAVRATYELAARAGKDGRKPDVATLARALDAAARALNGRTPEEFAAACAAALKPKGFVVTRAYSSGTARADTGAPPPPPPPSPSDVTAAPTQPPSPAVVALTAAPTPATLPPSPATTTSSPTPFAGIIGGGLPNKLVGSCGASPGCVAKRGGVVYVAGTGVEPCFSCTCNGGYAKRMQSNSRTRDLHYYCAGPFPTEAPTPEPTPAPAPPAPQVLRVASESRYALIDVQVPTGTQLVPAGGNNGVPAHGVHDVPLGSGGGLASVPVTMGVGHYAPGGAKVVYWSWTQSVLLASSGVTTFAPADPSLPTLLTKWQPSLTYSGQFWVGTTPHTAAFRFTGAGGWTLYTDGQQTGTGQVSLVAWPDYAAIIQWTVEPGNADRKVNWAFPWGCFKMRNGPSSWAVIEYCA